MDKPRMLGINQAARLLGVHRQTVYGWCRAGKIKAFQFSGKWLIPHEQFTLAAIVDKRAA